MAATMTDGSRARALTAALTARDGRPTARYGVHVARSWEPGAELARAVEREVFYEFFGNTPELLAREYGPYESASRFVVVVDHVQERPAGACRIIEPGPAGNKTVDDVDRVWHLPVLGGPWDVRDQLRRAAWDVATLAVVADYRGRRTNGLVRTALFQAITMLMSTHGVRWVTATLDLVVLDLVQQLCGEPFVPFPAARPRAYLDSPLSLPVYCDGDRYRKRLAVSDPDLHRFLFQGIGLEGLVSTPRWNPPAAATGTLAAAG